MTSLTSGLIIIYKMANRGRLKKGHHEILIFLIFFYNNICYYERNLYTKFHAIWSIIFMFFIETYIFGISNRGGYIVLPPTSPLRVSRVS